MKIKIDLRSDTVTLPTAAMREAILAAKVGDDVLGEDDAVNELQAYSAKLFGMDAALFCPSGTMTNQIAIHVHTHPGDEVICAADAHVYYYEGGGIALNSSASVRLISGDRGRFKAEDVETNINPDDPHRPHTSLVCVENTMNRGGGSIYDFEELKRIGEVCKKNNLAYHLDGARLFNAMIEDGTTPAQHGSIFDSISICLSKGLGAPVGSLLLGNKDFIKKALRRRKSLGGGMRQAGFLAAAGLYALQHHVERLKEDHHRAKEIEKLLLAMPWTKAVLPVETNIVIVKFNEGVEAAAMAQRFAAQNILCIATGRDTIRFVTHLDFNDDQLEEFAKRLKEV